MMNFPYQTKLSRHVLISVGLGLAFSYPTYAAAQVGSVALSAGVVSAKGQTKERPLKRKDEVNNGETITTGADSFVQIRFVDGGRVSLQELASLELTDVVYKDAQGKADSFTVSLTKGGFRAISGQIGKENRENYQFKTPLATVGVRGTVFDGKAGVVNNPQNPASLFPDGKLPPGYKPPQAAGQQLQFLSLRVTEGAIGAVFPGMPSYPLYCCDPSRPQAFVAIGVPGGNVQVFTYGPNGALLAPPTNPTPSLPPPNDGDLNTPADNLFRREAPAQIVAPPPVPTAVPTFAPTQPPTQGPTISPTPAPAPVAIPDIIPGVTPGALPNTSTPIPPELLNPVDSGSSTSPTQSPPPITSPGV